MGPFGMSAIGGSYWYCITYICVPLLRPTVREHISPCQINRRVCVWLHISVSCCLIRPSLVIGLPKFASVKMKKQARKQPTRRLFHSNSWELKSWIIETSLNFQNTDDSSLNVAVWGRLISRACFLDVWSSSPPSVLSETAVSLWWFLLISNCLSLFI